MDEPSLFLRNRRGPDSCSDGVLAVPVPEIAVAKGKKMDIKSS